MNQGLEDGFVPYGPDRDQQRDPTKWERTIQDSTTHHGFFSTHASGSRELALSSPYFWERVLATAIFRCWHIVIFFTVWGTAVTLIQYYTETDFTIPNALLKVVGSLLSFCTVQRANASFERYNQGRQMWSQIVNASRTFSRVVWFQVSDKLPDPHMSEEEQKARCTVEKKTALNLVEAFAVATKHYLRSEDGIYYTDLYHLVKFLPAYALPGGIIAADEANHSLMVADDDEITLAGDDDEKYKSKDVDHDGMTDVPQDEETGHRRPYRSTPVPSPLPRSQDPSLHEAVQESRETISRSDELYLLPANNPKSNFHQVFDVFPFGLIMEAYNKHKEARTPPTARKAAQMRALMMNKATSKNLPFEITLYLASYICTLQDRKTNDRPTLTTLTTSLNQLLGALTELERILTTPLPVSFTLHFWAVLTIWMLLLPFQIVDKMRWLTIPACTLVAGLFFGFLVAGEEIENPFQYSRNGLNMDHFTRNIIHHEIRAVTSSAPPNPYDFIFSDDNNLALANQTQGSKRITPEEWVKLGADEIQTRLHALA